MKKHVPISRIIFALLFLTISFVAKPAYTELVDSSFIEDVYLIEGELEQIKVYNMTRMSITNPDVADVVDADESEILLVASSAGETVLFIWDESGKRSINIHVSEKSLTDVRDRLKKLFREVSLHEAIVKINDGEGRVVVSGEIPDHKQELFEQIVDRFDEEIITLAIAEENENMIQIDMQITELSQTLAKSLGVEWSTNSGGLTGIGVGTSNNATTNGIVLPYQETLPDFDGSVGDFFKIGDFARTDALTATVNALIEEGKARVLSQPRLVVKNGEEASFLVGGEIPIRTTTSTTSGATQENVEFKEFGVGMTITPTLRKEKVEVVLNVEISDVDSANTSGDDVAFVTRSANTTVLLDDQQTIVLAGLIRQSESERVRKTPYLSDIPLVGLLFRSRSTPTANQETEVVISLTPHIVNTGVKSVFLQEKEEPDPIATTRTWIPRPTPKPSGLSQDMQQYIRAVQQQISQQVVYPQEAERYGWEGTVKVGLHILNDGTLAHAMVKESSGVEIIDDYALKTAQSVAPFSTFPPASSLHEMKVTVPIVYSLKRN